MNGLTWIGVLLLVAWAVLWLGLKLVSGAIHLLLVLALAAFVWATISSARARRGGP
ncbi:MAG TPA: DUF5670 family protein [Steroidobacteraceae bacterium]|nr:DUF5670 family protein [Steroidobacteraceae bacterium]